MGTPGPQPSSRMDGFVVVGMFSRTFRAYLSRGEGWWSIQVRYQSASMSYACSFMMLASDIFGLDCGRFVRLCMIFLCVHA